MIYNKDKNEVRGYSRTDETAPGNLTKRALTTAYVIIIPVSVCRGHPGCERHETAVNLDTTIGEKIAAFEGGNA